MRAARAVCTRVDQWLVHPISLSVCLPSHTFFQVSRHERRISQIEQLNQMPLYPTEKIIWDENIVPTEYYSGEGLSFYAISSQTHITHTHRCYPTPQGHLSWHPLNGQSSLGWLEHLHQLRCLQPRKAIEIHAPNDILQGCFSLPRDYRCKTSCIVDSANV